MTEEIESRDPQTCVTREELFQLHKHYETVARDERDFFFRYLNFYVGLLVAILAVTLTGLLGISRASLDPLLKLLLMCGLLIGPILTIIFSYIGFPVLVACHRRYVEARVTTINILVMLGLKGSITLDEGIRQPPYKNPDDHGFVAEFGSNHESEVLSKAKEEAWTSEAVIAALFSKRGTYLGMARASFRAFWFAAITLSVVIVIAVLLLIPLLIHRSA
jgi:hypothetical protein